MKLKMLCVLSAYSAPHMERVVKVGGEVGDTRLPGCKFPHSKRVHLTTSSGEYDQRSSLIKQEISRSTVPTVAFYAFLSEERSSQKNSYDRFRSDTRTSPCFPGNATIASNHSALEFVVFFFFFFFFFLFKLEWSSARID